MVLIISLSLNSFAQNAVHLNKDDKAPFEGNLLTLDITKQLYDDSMAKSSLQKQLDLTNQNVTILTQEKTILLDQNQKLIAADADDRRLTSWEKLLYFGSGVILSGLAIKGAMSLRP